MTTPHPAKYSKEIMPVLASSLIGCHKVLDPFAGTGRIHQLDGWVVDVTQGNKAKYGNQTPPPAVSLDLETYGIEIEPKWAEQHPRTQVGNAIKLPFADEFFDAVCTSPVYGNRMSDHHNAKDGSKRHTYTHYYGEDLHESNAGRMRFPGTAYECLHYLAWLEAWRVLRPFGRLVLNVKNFYADGEIVDVVTWHKETLERIGFALTGAKKVGVPGNKHGALRTKSVDYECVLVFFKPGNIPAPSTESVKQFRQ